MSYHLALGLLREPFSNSPDPDLLYRAKSHLECLQHMEIAVRLRRGLNVVLGEVGTGKTTLGRELVRILGADPDIEVHFLDDPYYATPVEFLLALCRLFGLEAGPLGGDIGSLKDALKSELLLRSAEGRRIVALIVDEGQKITPQGLELLRELLNFETNTHKLLQIVMFAQTEFEDMLAARPNLEDRVNFRYRLLPLDRKQTRRMIEMRLALCAPEGVAPKIFTPLAMRRIHRLTCGYPRKIVRLCHLSMLLAVGYGKKRIGWGLVGRAAKQSLSAPQLWLRRTALAGGFAAILALGAVGLAGPDLAGIHLKAQDAVSQARASLAALIAPAAPAPVESATLPAAPEEAVAPVAATATEPDEAAASVAATRSEPDAAAAAVVAQGESDGADVTAVGPDAASRLAEAAPASAIPASLSAAAATAAAPDVPAAPDAPAVSAAPSPEAAAPGAQAEARPVEESLAVAVATPQVVPALTALSPTAAEADRPTQTAAAATRILPDVPIAAHAAATEAGVKSAASAPASAPATEPGRDLPSGPRQGLGAAMDLAAAALPPEAKEQIIVVTAEDGLPVLPQSAGLLVAPPALPVATAGGKGSAGSGLAATAAAVGEASLGEASVRPGWALSRLAARVYGNGSRQVLTALAKANPGLDLTRLRAGESLVYPAIEAKAPPVGSCLVKVASADSLDQGLAIVARGRERHNLTLALFCTRLPGAGPRFDVVLAALYSNQARAQAALAALPAEMAGRAVLLGEFPEGTAYYTDLAEWRGDVAPKSRPAIGRQVAESRPAAGQARPFVAAPAAGAEE